MSLVVHSAWLPHSRQQKQNISNSSSINVCFVCRCCRVVMDRCGLWWGNGPREGTARWLMSPMMPHVGSMQCLDSPSASARTRAHATRHTTAAATRRGARTAFVCWKTAAMFAICATRLGKTAHSRCDFVVARESSPRGRQHGTALWAPLWPSCFALYHFGAVATPLSGAITRIRFALCLRAKQKKTAATSQQDNKRQRGGHGGWWWRAQDKQGCAWRCTPRSCGARATAAC